MSKFRIIDWRFRPLPDRHQTASLPLEFGYSLLNIGCSISSKMKALLFALAPALLSAGCALRIPQDPATAPTPNTITARARSYRFGAD